MSREAAIQAVKVSLQREFGGFLAQDPYNPERFWTMTAAAVIDAAKPHLQADALREAAKAALLRDHTATGEAYRLEIRAARIESGEL